MPNLTVQDRECVTLRVADLIDTDLQEKNGQGYICIDPDDAEKVFQAIQEQFDAGKNVTLSFEAVGYIFPVFLSIVMGKLLGEFSEEEVRDRLHAVDMNPDDDWKWDSAIHGAAVYSRNPSAAVEAMERSMEQY